MFQVFGVVWNYNFWLKCTNSRPGGIVKIDSRSSCLSGEFSIVICLAFLSNFVIYYNCE